MIDSIKRNASGAPDPTVYQAIKNEMPKAGDIWRNARGYEYIVLSTHAGYLNSLTLKDSQGTDDYPIAGRHTCPTMMTYTIERDYGTYCETVGTDEFNGLLMTVGEQLGFKVKIGEEQTTDDDGKQAVIDGLNRDYTKLYQDMEKKKAELDEAVKYAAGLEQELRSYRESGGVDWHGMYEKLVDKIVTARFNRELI